MIFSKRSTERSAIFSLSVKSNHCVINSIGLSGSLPFSEDKLLFFQYCQSSFNRHLAFVENFCQCFNRKEHMTDFLTADTNLPSYMMFPRFLLDMEINETAKMLYIILLDRARLSQKNEGWSDIDGHVFIYFTIEALAEVLHKSQMTIKTALAVLENQELIFRKRQGPGQPNRIYVKLPKETIHYTDRFLSLRQTENCPIDRQDSFPDTDRKLSGNKKEIKKNNLEKRGSKEPLSPYGKFQNVFLSEKELEDIRQTIPDWKDYIERLSGYMASTGKQYQNHAATIISWARQDHPASRQRNYESEEYETL